jgi:tetratricopeptide (TPR) repeat protein
MAREPEDNFNFSSRLQIAYFEIQKLKLDHARELIDQERRLNPSNGFIAYLDNYADLHYLLISEDKKKYTELLPKEDYRLNTLEAMPATSPYQRLLRADVHLHWAFAKMKFGNEVSACWNVIKAYKLLEENHAKFPSFTPTLKSLGMLHILIGSVPDKYSWVTKILGMKGNIAQGIAEIRQVSEQPESIFRQEAQLIDLLVHAYTLQLTPEKYRELKQLPIKNPDNLLLHFFTTSILIKEAKSEEALAVLNKAPNGPEYLSFPFLDLMRADILVQKGDYDKATNAYLRFQKNHKGVNFIKDSNFKLFLCKWLDGDDKHSAEIYLDKITKSGSTVVEADQYAQKFATDFHAGKIDEAQKVLFKARFANDGGYLNEAIELLRNYNENSFRSLSDKAEFNYRKGRIYQKSPQSDKAIPYFERAIELVQTNSLYFGPAAALQLGYIYKEKKQKDRAAVYFKKALAYKKYEYKNSIDNKARAALTEMEK